MKPIRWDGSPLTVRDIRRVWPECVIGFWGDVLYVKTRDNREAPVPLGWWVAGAGDGTATVTEEAVG